MADLIHDKIFIALAIIAIAAYGGILIRQIRAEDDLKEIKNRLQVIYDKLDPHRD
ncbi:hypothetical protein ABENE_05480 [Asticcacaulis benevestitus DSM 16100 = ATCC BAA-896]|uniref:Uncharacterized protein n=1 Tax=Asticcacaulis benevestitus DSM 16100 = ATCC BAA-896 TaxID=1121022 RepID=V4PIK5_9CAUL|nr:hypothetical protein ABENE_05480 [Asticcacaulis benevestitus DSM 16100 = ATCC BAA-896]